MRNTLALLVGAVVVLVSSGVALADKTVLYVQGRGWQNWDSETVSASGWNNRKLTFDGNAPLRDKSGCSGAACADKIVRDAISQECRGNDANGVANQCVIHCYSAGCLRVLKAVDDLRAQGLTPTGIQWVQGSGGASGGTDVASLSTSGGTKFLAKLIGQQEKVDYDLTPSAARSTHGYVQDAMWGPRLYHIAGYNDICKGLWVFKLCGNKYAKAKDSNGNPAGHADGVVPHASAAGCSSHGPVSDGCACSKYPYRTFDTGYTDTSCSGSPRDHAGIVGLGSGIIGADLTGTGYDKKRNFSDPTSQSECSGSSCDDGFNYSCEDDFTEHQGSSCEVLTTNVDSKTSNTSNADTYGATCRGKCGLSSIPGASCACDAGCGSRGNCCSDYSGAAQCHIVNAQ